MTTIEIKNLNGDVLFSYTKENNTIKETLEEAIKQGVSLVYANLRGADLHYANLVCADLRRADLRFAYLRGADLHYANLCGADLRDANLSRANLRGANLYDSNLGGANLYESNLVCVDLCSADLRYANLCGANLCSAILSNAYLYGANLGCANLCDANLRGANLYGANFRSAKNIPVIPLACPEEGSFIAWKKVNSMYLVKLEIPADAKRSSATSEKCRCDKAKVLSITNLVYSTEIDEITNDNYEPKIVYKVGEMVYPDSFDEDRWNECSHGIHFFINKQDAIDY